MTKLTVNLCLCIVNAFSAADFTLEGKLDTAVTLLNIHSMTEREVSDDDFKDILAQTKKFIHKEVIPRESEIADEDLIPDDIRRKAAEMGLFGYAIPQQWGGLGLNLPQDVELAMEFGYTSLALRSMFGTNNGIAGQVLVNFGTDDQKSAWLDGTRGGLDGGGRLR